MLVRGKGAMNKLSRMAGLVATITLASLHASATAHESQHLAIKIVLYDHASVVPAILAQAKRDVAKSFQPLGVDIEWVTPSGSPAETPGGPTSSRASLDRWLHVRILPRSVKEPALRGMLGVAAPSTEGARPQGAHVLYQRLGSEQESARVLGYVLAQLIAGLIRDANGEGIIVRANGEDVRLRTEGSSLLASQQADQIRSVVSALARGSVTSDK